MSALHHHQPDYVAALDTERRASASARAARPRESGDLARLVRAAARGEEAAWSAIVARFTRPLSRIVQAQRVPAADVDDVVQVTFVRLHQHIGTLREPAALPGWLATTARREAVRSLSRLRREWPLDADVVEAIAAPAGSDLPPAARLSAELAHAIDRLPELQRELLWLLSSDPAPSYAEISRTLAMPVGSIGPTRGRAVRRLRRDRRLAAAAAAVAADAEERRAHDAGAAVTHMRALWPE